MAVRPTDESNVSATERSLRALIADEDESALEGLARLVRELGHEVLSKAVSVRESAEVIATEDPAVALVRLHRDEDHALRLIQQIVEYASGPVIVLLDEDDTDFIPVA